jgi:hypothetical protein
LIASVTDSEYKDGNKYPYMELRQLRYFIAVAERGSVLSICGKPRRGYRS